MSKITQEELQKLTDLNSLIAKLKTNIADYNIQSNMAINQVVQYGSMLSQHYDELESKYGKIESINHQTGEYVNKEDIGG